MYVITLRVLQRTEIQRESVGLFKETSMTLITLEKMKFREKRRDYETISFTEAYTLIFKPVPDITHRTEE